MSGEWFSRSMLRSVGAFRIACCRLVTSFMNGIEWFSLCQASVRDTRKSSVLSSASSVCGIEIFLSCFSFVTFVGDNRFFHHTVCRIEYGRKQHHEHLNSQITNKYFHRLLAIKNWTDNNWLVINRSQSIDFCYFFVDVIFVFFFFGCYRSLLLDLSNEDYYHVHWDLKTKSMFVLQKLVVGRNTVRSKV